MGLIGGSLGLALKRLRPDVHVCGVVRKAEQIQKVLASGAADEVTCAVSEGIHGARWIVLASSPASFSGILKEIRPHLERSQIVMDVGSVKGSVMTLFRRELGNKIPYLGAHPIAGSQRSGIRWARWDLFQGAQCILTVPTREKSSVLREGKKFWELVGSKVVVMSAQEHDLIFALVSHMPHVVSFCLVNALAGRRKAVDLAGEAWRDMTRIAKSSTGLWTDICLLNRRWVLYALKAVSKQIDFASKKLRSADARGLKRYFDRAQ